MKLVRDLLMGPGNQAWDLARFGAAWGFVTFTGAVILKAASGADISLVELGTGYASISLAAGGLIALKDRARIFPPAE